MLNYNFLQLTDFFIIYCFLGWIWETCYVSAKQKKFVNRGFLHGPVIPIYGFAAMTVLFATMPFKDNLLLVFISGFLAASALELVTGITMEAIFGVRYWDYRRYPLNIRGYVSLPTSTVWGLFSILMVRFIHLPVDRLVMSLSPLADQMITIFLIAGLSFDFALSAREALDLKELLARVAELTAVQKASKKMDAVVATIDADKEIVADKVKEITSRLSKLQLIRIKGILDRNPSATSASSKYREMFDMFRSGIVDTVKRYRKGEN